MTMSQNIQQLIIQLYLTPKNTMNKILFSLFQKYKHRLSSEVITLTFDNTFLVIKYEHYEDTLFINNI